MPDSLLIVASVLPSGLRATPKGLGAPTLFQIPTGVTRPSIGKDRSIHTVDLDIACGGKISRWSQRGERIETIVIMRLLENMGTASTATNKMVMQQ